MKTIKGFACTLFSVLALSATANAATENHASGWYVGGTLGHAVFDGKYTDTFLPVTGTSLSFDNDTGGITVLGGYQLNRYFGVEASLMFSGDVADDSSYDASVGEITIAPKVTWPIHERFSLYAKAGISVASYLMHMDRTVPGADEDLYWSGIGLKAGIGAQVAVTKKVYLRISYDYTDLRFEPNEDSAYNGYVYYWVPDIDATLRNASLGAYYRF